MKPSPHEGTGVGAPHGDRFATVPGAFDPTRALRTFQQAADAAFAGASFAVNQSVVSHIALAHIAGNATKRIASTWSDAAQSLPPGSFAQAIELAARSQSAAAEAVMHAASEVGRQVGRLMFAFPPKLIR
jgi:hypothetical protein